MAGQSRWAGLAGIAVGNLLPLWLVWTGRLGIGDLVLVYLLELGVSFVLFCVSLPRRRVRGGIRLVLTVAALGLLLGPLLTYYTVAHVTWDGTTLGVVALTLASSAIGLVASLRRRGRRWREGVGGGFAWRFVLMVVALVAAGAGAAQERLLAAGWEPHDFGRGWALPAGELLTRAALALDLPGVVVAAGILCTYRLVNELLHEVHDILVDEAVSARRGMRAVDPTTGPA